MKFRRYPSIIVMVATLLALALPRCAWAQFTYTTNNGVITITGYTGSGGNVTIPSTTNGYPVTTIGTEAFYLQTNLTTVTIPDSVTSIGAAAFQECWKLTSVVIGAGVTNYIQGAFEECPSLTSITVNPTNSIYASAGGVLFNNTLTTLILYPEGLTGSYVIPSGVTNIDDYAFYDCEHLTSVTIPNGVSSIGFKVFWNCVHLTSVTIPDSVANIGVDAFEYCSDLTNVVIPDNVTNIDDFAFYSCAGLTQVTIGNSVTRIGEKAFALCDSLTSVTVPDSVTSIGVSAFNSCSVLGSVTIGDSVTNIGDAFYACPGLTNISVSPSNPIYASAGGVLFNITLTTLIQCPGGLAGSYAIPNSVTSIGDEAFQYCFSLTNVVIAGSVANIGSKAFQYCSGLTNMAIGNGVTSIGDEAFYQCSGLTSVTISSNVTNIGTFAFADCAKLHQAYFQGNTPSVDGAAGSADWTDFSGESGTVYYLPVTTGWGATFGGWPAALWRPQMHLANHSETSTNGFGFNINWASDQTVVVEASTNLQNWTPISTNTLVNGTNAFWDSDWSHYPQRFYRVRSQ